MQCVNTNILILIVHIIIMYPETPIYGRGAILSDAWFILIYMVLVNPILNVFSPWLGLKLLGKFMVQRKVKGGNAQVTQAEAHAAYELPVWDPAFAHAGMVKDVLTCIFFQPILPLSSVFGLACLILMHWSQKVRLLRYSVRPISIGDDISKVALYLLSLGPLVYGVA